MSTGMGLIPARLCGYSAGQLSYTSTPGALGVQLTVIEKEGSHA
jgi:hypothetical protein